VYPSERAIAGLVLAHGAGAGQTSQFMVQAARGLASRGVTTATFDFPYMEAGRKVPDRAPILEEAWRNAITEMRTRIDDLPLFIGGKSMGGRIASQVASQGSAAPLHGLVFLGYPLHPPGKPEQRRDAHLPAIKEPMLFVQGTRDAFGTAAEIQALLPRLQRATLREINGGDHSFKVPGGKAAQEPVFEDILHTVAGFIRAASGRA
jgi:uncharacterized protein